MHSWDCLPRDSGVSYPGGKTRSKIDLAPEAPSESRSEASGTLSGKLISALTGLPKDSRDRAQTIALAPTMGEMEAWDDIEFE